MQFTHQTLLSIRNRWFPEIASHNFVAWGVSSMGFHRVGSHGHGSRLSEIIPTIH